MAAPASLTIRNLSGRFKLNKSLSDLKFEVLKLAGVNWLVRKALELGQLHLGIKHYVDTNGIEHIDIDQVLYGGIAIAGTQEHWVLDWEPKEHEDHVFGIVEGKARRTKLGDLEDLCADIPWTEDTMEIGVVYGCISSDSSKNKISWRVEQTWGMAMVNEERRYLRQTKFTGPANEIITSQLVYDYVGPVLLDHSLHH